jgi:stage II sporulation protein D
MHRAGLLALSFFLTLLGQASSSGVALPDSVDVRVLSKYHIRNLECFCPGGEIVLSHGNGERKSLPASRGRPLRAVVVGTRLRLASGPQSLGSFERVRLQARDGLFVVRGGGRLIRKYRGSLSLEPETGGVKVVNRVALNDYLKGVVPSEMGSGAPFEASKAQAVLARTWVLVRLGRHRGGGYDFCDLTHCQSYQGADWERPSSSLAVDSTAGEIATDQGEPIEVFYHSTCGGHTAKAEEIWGDVKESYLGGIADSAGRRAYCQGSEHMRWRFAATLGKLRSALAKTPETHPGKTLKDILPAAFEQSGRVSRVKIIGSLQKEVSGEVFRTAVCRALGWNTVKSTWFTVHRQKGQIVLIGRGFGHGVGMCQYGARGRALAGQSYRQIIEAYYPGAKVEKR